MNEIYEYMRMMERAQSVKKDYLGGKTGVIIPKMRSVLVEWLVEVHQQFALLQETLYLSVAVLDRYMQVTKFTIFGIHTNYTYYPYCFYE